jgi:hypothetical protein
MAAGNYDYVFLAMSYAWPSERFITLFSQVRIHSEFGANAQMRRICWRCAKFLAGAKLSMAKFGASAWMRETFLEMRNLHLFAPDL